MRRDAGSTTPAGSRSFRHQWYDPATGRFLTQDPIGLAGGVNLYAYAASNPIAFSDPFGLYVEFGSDKAKAAYLQARETLEACANSGSSGPCDADHARAARAGLNGLAAIEADTTITVTVNLTSNGPDVYHDRNRSTSSNWIINFNPSAGRFATGDLHFLSTVGHEVFEAGMFLRENGGVYSNYHYCRLDPQALTNVENPIRMVSAGRSNDRANPQGNCNAR